ncbi:hypothetical protein LINPERHAP1_LOCUS41887 [Linum perenne]
MMGLVGFQVTWGNQ